MSTPLDLKLDPTTWDLVVPMSHVSGVDGVAQLIRTAVQMVAGEWFRDLDAGLDWYGKVLGQRYNADQIQREFRRVILGVAGVSQILSLSTGYESNTRTLTVAWRVQVDLDGVLTTIQDQIKKVTP